jgi:hypothetical protein
MKCEACKREMHPVWEIVAPDPARGLAGGLVPKCPFHECRAAVPQSVIDAERIAAEEKVAAEIAAERGTPSPARVAAAPDIGAPLAPPATPEVDEPPDVLALILKRLAFVRGKVAELRKFETEEQRLEALLAAAEAVEVHTITGGLSGIAIPKHSAKPVRAASGH